MLPTISQVSCLPSPFDRDVEELAAAECRQVEVWLTKLEQYLASHTLNDVRYALERFGMRLPVAAMQGGVVASQGVAREEAWQLLRRRLALCQELGIGTLVVACDVPPPLTSATVAQVERSLRELAEAGEAHGVRIAIEFQAQSALGNNVQTAAALVNQVASAFLGLCLDAFHWHVGPSTTEDLAYLTPQNLFHVQVCDLADTPRELARDAHRILPGEGDIPLAPLLAHLRKIGYAGCVSIELMNPQLWQVPPLQLADAAMASLRRLLAMPGP